MDKAKQKRLESKGWHVGSTAEFLDLTPEESAYVDLKVSLSELLQEKRKQNHLTQMQLAERIKSSQSRVAKMEKADSSVSIDLMVKTLYSLGSRNDEIGEVISGTVADFQTYRALGVQSRRKSFKESCETLDRRLACYKFVLKPENFDTLAEFDAGFAEFLKELLETAIERDVFKTLTYGEACLDGFGPESRGMRISENLDPYLISTKATDIVFSYCSDSSAGKSEQFRTADSPEKKSSVFLGFLKKLRKLSSTSSK